MANFTLYEGKICIVFTGKSDVQKVWERLVKMTAFGIFSPLLENKNAWAEMDYNRLAIHNGITLLECTKACGNNTLCQSFYFNQYNSMTGRTYCELFQKVCNPYFLISSPGLNYYVKQRE